MKRLLLFLYVVTLVVGMVGIANALPWLSDPVASVTNLGDTLILRKELSAFPNYGLSGSDVLYSGDSGEWIFDLTGITLGDYDTATVTASLVLDDHYTRPTSNYSLQITLAGDIVFNGPTDIIHLVHGAPYGNLFQNWTSTPFDALQLVDPFIVSMTNTSPTGGPTYTTDWIAIDYLELKLTAAPVPEPSTWLLLCLGSLGMIGIKKKFS